MSMTSGTDMGGPDGRVVRLGTSGSRIEVLASGREAGGEVCVLRWVMSPSSRGPGPHFHRTFSETFIVEAGELDVLSDGVWRTVRAGEQAHAPRGGVHALRKSNDDPASVLMILTPGVPREDYFAALAVTDDAHVDALHERFDNCFVCLDDSEPNGAA